MKSKQKVKKKSKETALLRRDRLPDTRRSVTHKFKIDQLEGYITVGLYDDGRPGEVFIKIAKHGSTVSGLVDTIAVLTSLALQYGVPVAKLVNKLEFTRFDPSGWTQNPEIRHAQSLVDYIFRWLGMTFCEEYRTARLAELATVDAATSETDEAASS